VRTTLTIDDDVAALVQEEVRRSGDSFKSTVNSLLRQGLTARRQPRPKKRFLVKPLTLGLPKGLSYDCTSKLLDELEGPYRR
jgi:hypothetical protein